MELRSLDSCPIMKKTANFVDGLWSGRADLNRRPLAPHATPNMSDYSAPGVFLQGTNSRLPCSALPTDHDMVEISKGILCAFKVC
jgi:hypothetical protein